MIRSLTFAAALGTASAAVSFSALAQDIELAFPVDCTLGQDCFIQNYVDRDPTPGRQDVGCGHLTYDRHSGTDIALYTEAELARNVAVTAVAPGTVRVTRDGMPDIRSNHPDAPPLNGQDCGNAVVIDHKDSWASVYCHLAEGSVTVSAGERVTEETVLGHVGLSGRTEFPHLHLEIRRGRNEVDPFQPDARRSCGVAADTLWAEEIGYVSAGILSAGAGDAIPRFDDVKAGTASMARLPVDAPALVFFAQVFGPRVGDRLRFVISGPDGVFLDQTAEFDRNQARAFRAVGRRISNGPLAPGLYTANIAFARDGATLDRIATRIEVYAE